MMPSIVAPKSAKTSHVPKKINDFAVLPIVFPATAAYPHTSTHFLYMRPDAPKDADEITEDNQRSLFVNNIPITSSETEFRRFFKKLSPNAVVDSVLFASAEKHRTQLAVTGDVVVQGTKVGVPIGVLRGGASKKRKRGREAEDEIVKRKLAEMEMPSVWARGVWESGSSAVVRFVDRDAMLGAWKAVLRAVKEARRIEWVGDEEGGLGLERYKTHHNLTYPPHATLQNKVNAYLTHFANLETLRNAQLAKLRNVPDEDGFVTVTRGGRAGAGRIEDAQVQQQRLKERESKRIGKDFYRFQTREERRKREGELKRRFEEERRRVDELKRSKKRIAPE